MLSRPWHVLHVTSNHEKKVAQHLAVRAIEHYLPLYTVSSEWTDRTVETERPLFSGYVFARCTPQNRVSVISIPGVLRLLGNSLGNMVSAEELAKIRAAIESGILIRPHPMVARGTRVRVLHGAFAGVEGIVVDMRKQCRVVLKLSAVKQCFSLEVDISDLAVIDEPQAREERELRHAFDR